MTFDIGPAVWTVAVVGDTIVAGGPSGLIALTLSREAIRPRRDLRLRPVRE